MTSSRIYDERFTLSFVTRQLNVPVSHSWYSLPDSKPVLLVSNTNGLLTGLLTYATGTNLISFLRVLSYLTVDNVDWVLKPLLVYVHLVRIILINTLYHKFCGRDQSWLAVNWKNLVNNINNRIIQKPLQIKYFIWLLNW